MNDAIIKISGLTKRYGEKTAVNNLYLTVEPGEVFGLLGPNGAGKTTTTLMLLGLTEPTEGFAWIDGLDCTKDSVEIKKTVGYLPDNAGFYGDLTGRENLRFTGMLNGLDRELCEKRIDELIGRVGLSEAADQKTSTYSRGMKQRLGIADVLMKDPRVIIMDEPTLGLDPQGMEELLDLIKDLSVKDGRTIMLSSHQLHQVQKVCDRVGIFVKGSLIACGPIEVLGRQLEQEGHYVTEAETTQADEALCEIIRQMETVSSVSLKKNRLTVESSADIRASLARTLIQHGYDCVGLRQKGGDLDEIYRKYFEQAD